MLSFVEAAVPRAALIYNYATDDLYTRLPDEQTMLNGEPIYVSDRPLDRSIVELEMRRDLPERSALIDAIDRRIYTNQKIAACAGFGMTQVIKGATEGRVQISGYGKLYDYLPGQILVDGAGGVVQTPGEDVWDWANLNSIVSNKLVAGELRNIIDGVLRAS
jgi:fructose-1,6-bisphosphatase/inositol monophosphatase family enzyme